MPPLQVFLPKLLCLDSVLTSDFFLWRGGSHLSVESRTFGGLSLEALEQGGVVAVVHA